MLDHYTSGSRAGGSGPEWELYEDAGGEWRWRFQARNGRALADSGERHASEPSGERAVEDAKAILRDL